MKYNYYKEQLDKVNINSVISLQIINSKEQKTKWFDINLESIKELRKYLDEKETLIKEQSKWNLHQSEQTWLSLN